MDLPFDLQVDIPQRIWREVDQYIARESDPGRNNLDQSLLRIAMLDPERARIVRKKPFFGEEVRSRIGRKNQHSASKIDKMVNVLIDSGRFQNVLGSVAEVEKSIDTEKDIVSKVLKVVSRPLEPLGVLRYFAQLFPEKRALAMQAISIYGGDQDPWQHFKDDLNEEIRIDIAFNPHAVLSYAVNLVFFFPEHTNEVLDLIRPVWSEFKRALQERSTQIQRSERNYESYTDGVVSMNFLAEVAKLQNRKVVKATALPDRLVS